MLTKRLPYGDPIAKAKRIRDASHIKLKEHRVQTIASSWKPNYEAVENGSPRFNSGTYGNWHINPRFKYKRVWRELVEQEGVGACDENDTWQEQMADEIVKNRGAIVTGCSTQKSPTMTASTGQHASFPHFNAKVTVSLVQ